MKRLAVFIAVMLALTLVPAAEATLRIQGVGSTLFSFDGPTSVSYRDSGFSGSYYHDMDTRFVSASGTRGGPGISLSMQRPSYTRLHRFDEPKYNYRTREYGDWQLTNAHASWPDKNTNIGVSQLYGQYSVRGNINGYSGGSTGIYARSSGYNRFADSQNLRSYGYPYTYSSFGYSSSPSTYVSSGSRYY